MDKVRGKAIIDAAVQLDKHFGDLDTAVSSLDDGAEKTRMISALGQLFGIMYHDIIRPIVAAYPDLDPDTAGYGGEVR